MEKGKLLGSGVTAEIYEWGPDKILKLYFDKYSTIEQVKHEAGIGHSVHEAGIDTPAIYDTVEVDDRKGIIYEKILGKTMYEHLVAEPWNLYQYILQMAILQHNIHKSSARGLPSQRNRFTYTVRISSYLLGYRTKRILEYMEGLPDGNNICHGDLYFNNIIVSGQKLVPIDWNGAYIGNPLSDVAGSGIVICSPALPTGVPGSMAMFFYYHKWMAFYTYMHKYIELSKANFEDIDAWLLPVAAAKLKDKIQGEKQWLMDLVDEQLKKL